MKALPNLTATVTNRPKQEAAARHVLVADDDAILREHTALGLKRAGHKVETVEDGLGAWSALQSETYDLLITDNDMPFLTGLQLVRKIRLARMPLPIIMVSGSISGLSIDELPWLDCAAIVAKPYTTDQLGAIVAEVLRAASDEAARFKPAAAVALHLPLSVAGHRRWGINE